MMLHYGLTIEQMKAMRVRVLAAIGDLQNKTRTFEQELAYEGYRAILEDLDEGIKGIAQHG